MAKGYRAPKMPGGMNMMGQLQKLQQQMEETQAKLAEETLMVTAGGGAIKITITGDQHVKGIEIDPELLKDADVEMLQDLFLTAINSALDKSRDLASQRMGPLAGGLPF